MLTFPLPALLALGYALVLANRHGCSARGSGRGKIAIAVLVFLGVACLLRRLAQNPNPNPNTSSLRTLLRGALGFGGARGRRIKSEPERCHSPFRSRRNRSFDCSHSALPLHHGVFLASGSGRIFTVFCPRALCKRVVDDHRWCCECC